MFADHGLFMLSLHYSMLGESWLGGISTFLKDACIQTGNIQRSIALQMPVKGPLLGCIVCHVHLDGLRLASTRLDLFCLHRLLLLWGNQGPYSSCAAAYRDAPS